MGPNPTFQVPNPLRRSGSASAPTFTREVQVFRMPLADLQLFDPLHWHGAGDEGREQGPRAKAVGVARALVTLHSCRGMWSPC